MFCFLSLVVVDVRLACDKMNEKTHRPDTAPIFFNAKCSVIRVSRVSLIFLRDAPFVTIQQFDIHRKIKYCYSIIECDFYVRYHDIHIFIVCTVDLIQYDRHA